MEEPVHGKTVVAGQRAIHCILCTCFVMFDFCFAAVRDDRMPGGRNSGAVYSLYKVCESSRCIHSLSVLMRK